MNGPEIKTLILKRVKTAVDSGRRCKESDGKVSHQEMKTLTIRALKDLRASVLPALKRLSGLNDKRWDQMLKNDPPFARALAHVLECTDDGIRECERNLVFYEERIKMDKSIDQIMVSLKAAEKQFKELGKKEGPADTDTKL